MPEAVRKPYSEDIEKPSAPADAVSAHLDIDIVSKPCAQRYIPAAPELGYAFGDIGIIEVFYKVEAEYSAKANSHVGIAGKIKVYMQGKGNCIKPVEHHGLVSRHLKYIAYLS